MNCIIQSVIHSVNIDKIPTVRQVLFQVLEWLFWNVNQEFKWRWGIHLLIERAPSEARFGSQNFYYKDINSKEDGQVESWAFEEDILFLFLLASIRCHPGPPDPCHNIVVGSEGHKAWHLGLTPVAWVWRSLGDDCFFVWDIITASSKPSCITVALSPLPTSIIFSFFMASFLFFNPWA